MFKDRTETGKMLAQKLENYRGTNSIVLALPRGGVVLGYEIARALELPLDIITTRKIGHPSNPEYAIGAVDENGLTILNKAEVASIDKEWLEEKITKQKEEARRRSSLYRGEKDHLKVNGKIVIIVDDGIATGFTIRLAMRSIKEQEAEKIIIAVPVAPPEPLRELQAEGADEIVLLEKPEKFMGAIGAHYLEFNQVDDREVVRLLHSLS